MAGGIMGLIKAL